MQWFCICCVFQYSVQLFSAQKSLQSIPHTSMEKSLQDKKSHIISNTNAVREIFFLSKQLHGKWWTALLCLLTYLSHSNSCRSKLGFVHNFVDKNGQNERDFFPPLKLGNYFLSLVFRFSTATSHSTLMWKQSQKLFSNLNKKLKSGSE